VGIVDADALPTSERPSPAAPSTITAAVLVVRFCFEAGFTRGMVASFVSLVVKPRAALSMAQREVSRPVSVARLAAPRVAVENAAAFTLSESARIYSHSPLRTMLR
jgi:hypothetical protein